jgi:hypothetical protein
MQTKLSVILTSIILLATALGTFSNVKEHQAIDNSKLPDKVERSKGFQRWITNLKNKEFDIEADEFRLLEENEVHNSKWTKIYSIENHEQKELLENTLVSSKDNKKIVFSPDKREIIDYRNENRGEYSANEVRFYGQREDKILDTMAVDCSVAANCYFDRAFFIENDIFVVSELSRNIDKKEENAPRCLSSDSCEYTFKIHLIDLKNNSRKVYQSEPFSLILSDALNKI